MKHNVKLNVEELQDFVNSKEIEVASTTHQKERLKLVFVVGSSTYKVSHGDEILVNTPSLAHAVKVFENA